jgi:uncharacterized protein YecE (DUF72 family)
MTPPAGNRREGEARQSRAKEPAPPDPELYAEASSLAERASLPARHENVLFATAGWNYPSVVKSKLFYPKGVTTPEARLKHYAEHFSLVEVDATFYALISKETVERWVEWTPDTFHFDVKSHPVLTQHPIDVRRLPADLRQALEDSGAGARVYPDKLPLEIRTEIELRFFASLEPLQDSGRLGAVLLQFPPWFVANQNNSRAIETLAERFPKLPFAVEFRHPSWVLPERRARVFDLLRRHDLAYVAVDEPEARVGGLPPIVEVTSPRLAVVRFHGQNAAAWNRRGVSVAERFDYLYHPRELDAWVGRVESLAAEAESVHAVFNNCVRNYAIVNAKDLAVLLTESSDAGDPAGGKVPSP